MAIFIFVEGISAKPTLIAQTGPLGARSRRADRDPDAPHLLLATGASDQPTKLDPREIGQLYTNVRIVPILDSALALVETPPRRTVLPAVDRQLWVLGRVDVEEWSERALRVAHVSSPAESAIGFIERAATRGDLDADIIAFLTARAVVELVTLQRRAVDSRRDALQTLAENEDPLPAQDEILRLATVAQSADALASDPTLPSMIRSKLVELTTACETASTTMSASLTAALLAAQHRAERADAERRSLIERGQQRIAAIAAALVLPTIVLGFAGANFFSPSPRARWWIGLVTGGLALLAAVAGVKLAIFLSTATRRTVTGLAYATAVAAGLIIAFAIIFIRP